MPKVSPLQTNFNGGEFSPLTKGRLDSDRYKMGLDLVENYLNTEQGPLTRRPGTRFVAEVKTSANKTRLQAFTFSVTQSYILEFSAGFMRVFMDGGIVESGPGVPYTLATGFTEAQLFELKFTQSADVLYITHPDFKPLKLLRLGHASWVLNDLQWVDGPYLNINITSTTMVCSAATGVVTLTASSTAGINGGNGFQTTDATQARFVRFQVGAAMAYARISTWISTTQVDATVISGNAPVAATAFWRLGAMCTSTDAAGFPGASVFHEDRLCFTGYEGAPARVDMSYTGLYENFSPTLTDLTVTAANAIALTINTSELNAAKWITSDEKGLLVGTTGGEFNIRSSSQTEAMSPTNVTARQATAWGSANIQPVQMGKATLFVEGSGKKVRELIYFYDVDGFRANNMTVLSKHITGGGIVQMAKQKQPQATLWCVRDDGELAAMVYERDAESLRAPWTRHRIGGNGHNDTRVYGFGLCESVACIPSPDGTRTEVWLVIKRYIDGAWKRYVEYIDPDFEDDTDLKDAFFVDSGLSYDVPLTITGITTANPAVVTSAAHGLANGDEVILSSVIGLYDGYDDEGLPESGIDGYTLTVAGVTANTFQLSGFDSTGLTPYVSGGQARKKISTITGLGHLEGQTVKILGDGAVQTAQIVAAGSITLPTPAAVVHVGLSYLSQFRLLRIDAGSADGTSLGKTRRINRIGVLLHRTLGVKWGMALNGSMQEYPFRNANDPAGVATPLFSGIVAETIDADYDFDNQFCLRQEDPLPGTILAVMAGMVTQDR